MTFMHAGLALAGVLCIAVPILIHLLLRQRRRPIVWAAMRFLMEAYKRQRRKLRLQQLILLLLRCAMILLIALAIGRPLLEQSGLLGGSGRVVYFLVDNGLAAGATSDTSESALDRHRAAVREMIAELSADDQAGLVALGGPAAALVVPASSDHGAVTSLLDGLQVVDSATDLSGALDRVAPEINAARESGAEVVLVILSDFYTGSADVSQPLSTALVDFDDITVIASPPRASSPGNVQIVGVEPLRSVVLTGSGGVASDQNVRVTLRRTGPIQAEAGTSRIKLRVSSAEQQADDAIREQVVRWKPGQSEATVWVKLDAATEGETSEGQVLTASIDRDAVDGDNTFRRTIAVREALAVGVIDQRRFGGGPGADSKAAADWIRLALQPTTGTPVDVYDIEPAQVDAPTLAGLDAVFVPSPHLIQEGGWDRLRQFADRGGMVIVTPPAGVAVHLWPDAMERSFGVGWRLAREVTTAPEAGWRLDEHSFGSLLTLIESELPTLVRPVVVDRTLAIEEVTTGTQTVLSLRDGRPWLVAAEPGEGDDTDAPRARESGRGLLIYLGSAPELAWSTLPAMPLMVPLTQELVRQGVGEASGAWSMIAGGALGASPATARFERIGSGDVIMVDPERTYGESAVRNAGVWRALDAAARSRGLVAVNADPAGGRLAVQTEGVVRGWLAEALGDGTVGDELGAGVSWYDPVAPGRMLSSDERGSPVALPLLIAALALALLEALLARWFSHASIDGLGVSVGGATAGGSA